MIKPQRRRATLTVKGLHPHRRLREAVAGALILGLALGGCGGADGTAATTPAPSAASARVTKAAFLTRANAICREHDPVLRSANAKLAKRPPEAQAVAIVKSMFVPTAEAEIIAVRALRLPYGEATTLQRLLGLANTDLNDLSSDPTLTPASVFRSFERRADNYGLPACIPSS